MSSNFVVIPAIDLMDGCCVRLLQGKKENKTIYSNNPVEFAKKWANLGAGRMHVVDLDGAFTGTPKNLESIKGICSAIDIPVELGGGLRNLESIKAAFDAGVSYVIIGTAVIKDMPLLETLIEKYGNKIIAGIDAKNGKVAIDGWVNVADYSNIDLAKKMELMGVKTIISTDISTDGMLTGPNLTSLKDIADAVPDVKIIASGGISSVDDLIAVKNLNCPNMLGAISGKALYEGKIDLREAIKKLS